MPSPVTHPKHLVTVKPLFCEHNTVMEYKRTGSRMLYNDEHNAFVVVVNAIRE
ncbi:MAG: hypothetical protein AB8B63_22585 [Granulosicoccus sp.]